MQTSSPKFHLLCLSQYFWPKPSLPSLGKLNCCFKNGLMMVLIFHIILRVLMCLVQVIGKFYSIGSFLYPGSSHVFLSVIPKVLESLELDCLCIQFLANEKRSRSMGEVSNPKWNMSFPHLCHWWGHNHMATLASKGPGKCSLLGIHMLSTTLLLL